MFGANDDRRETEGRGVPGMSPRSEVLDDFLPSAGEADRCKLTTLELRRKESGGKAGEEGLWRGSEGCLGECTLGDRGSGAFAAAWSDRRFSDFERRLASLFVDGLAARGVPGLPSLELDEWSGEWFCMLAGSSRRAARVLSTLRRVFDVVLRLVTEKKVAMTVARHVRGLLATQTGLNKRRPMKRGPRIGDA